MDLHQSEVILLPVEEPNRLDLFLKSHFDDWSRTKLAAAIDEGHILVEGHTAKPGTPLKVGQLVTVLELPDPAPMNLEPMDIPLDVRFEDKQLLVVNKPRGLPTHPASSYTGATLVNALLHHADRLSTGTASYRPGIVHRLDKETTGLIVIAKTDYAHAQLAAQIAEKTAERRYFALAYGTLDQARFRVEAPIARDPATRLKMTVHSQGRWAATEFRRIAVSGGGTLVSCRLESGRTHQIRVHLLAVGHPVKGDELYAKNEWAQGPMQLHAGRLSFNHPVTKERMDFYCPAPDDFDAKDLADPALLGD